MVDRISRSIGQERDPQTFCVPQEDKIQEHKSLLEPPIRMRNLEPDKGQILLIMPRGKWGRTIDFFANVLEPTSRIDNERDVHVIVERFPDQPDGEVSKLSIAPNTWVSRLREEESYITDIDFWFGSWG